MVTGAEQAGLAEVRDEDLEPLAGEMDRGVEEGGRDPVDFRGDEDPRMPDDLRRTERQGVRRAGGNGVGGERDGLAPVRGKRRAGLLLRPGSRSC